MASWLISLLSSFWPSKTSSSDLNISRQILDPLPILPSTKHFSFALRHPDNPSSVVFILATVLLSERSASDARSLIRTINPRAVIAQVGSDALSVVQTEQLHPSPLDVFPTSPVHVIAASFHGGNSSFKYLKMAEVEVVRAIFGTTFTGHVAAAKEAAALSKSSFYYLEGPISAVGTDSDTKNRTVPAKDVAGSSRNLSFGLRSLSSAFDTNFIAPHVVSSLQDSLATALSSAGSTHRDDHGDIEYECPAFAHSFYPLLADLHNVYRDLPGMSLALERTQKLLRDVDKGKDVNHSELALSQCFRLAVEGLRVALNVAAHSPLKVDKSATSKIHFDDLPYEEKCHVLLAQALKQQAQESQTVVAILDADTVAGIRKHWTTPVPDHVAALAKECLVLDADMDNEETKKKVTLLDKAIVVVGAGAAAAVGLSSLSNFAPVSTAMKIVTFKIPTIIKLGLLQTKKGAIIAMAKLMSPVTKLMVPAAKGFGPSSASLLKATSSTAKIRTAAHSVIATAERASLSAIRTAFYNAMRNRHRKGARGRPWVSLGASIAACVGILTFGDGIENAIEAIPEAPTIARLGRGVNSLCHASETLKQAEDSQYWETMYRRLYGLVNRKDQ